jgi:hypothetical protein
VRPCRSNRVQGLWTLSYDSSYFQTSNSAANTAVGDTGVPMDPVDNKRSQRDVRIAHFGVSSRVSDPSVWIMLGERGAACAR